jgi:hypothetical protein
VEQLSLPAPIESSSFDTREDKPYAAAIKQDIKACTEALVSISLISMEIKAQGSVEGWWKSGDNMRRLAETVAQSASVQQKTINMVVLLMAAAGRMKSDYNVIMESIEELSRAHSGSVEVLEYLVKIKQTVTSIKKRDDLLESLMTYTNDLRQSLSDLDENVRNQFEGMAKEVSALNGEQVRLGTTLESLRMEQDSNMRATAASVEDQARIGTEQRNQLRKELMETIGIESQNRRAVEAELRYQIQCKLRWYKVALWLMVCLSLGMSVAALLISIR